MKHEATITYIFALFHEPWMSDTDKIGMNALLLRMMNVTMEELDAQIEVGVSNGYSPEEQAALARKMLAPLIGGQ